jgi:hypothetical protein
MVPKEFSERLRHAERGDGAHGTVFQSEQQSEFCLAHSCRVFEHHLEYGCQIARSPANDFEHLGGRSLLRQRFDELRLRFGQAALALRLVVGSAGQAAFGGRLRWNLDDVQPLARRCAWASSCCRAALSVVYGL